MKIETSEGIKITPWNIEVSLDRDYIRGKIEKVLRKWDVSGSFYRDCDFEKLLDECVEEL